MISEEDCEAIANTYADISGEEIENISVQDPRDPEYSKPVFDVPIRIEKKPIENPPAVFVRSEKLPPEIITQEQFEEQCQRISMISIKKLKEQYAALGKEITIPVKGDPNYIEWRELLVLEVEKAWLEKHPGYQITKRPRRIGIISFVQEETL